MSARRKQPSGHQNRKKKAEREKHEQELESLRRQLAAARGERESRYGKLLLRRPKRALGMAEWLAETLCEAIADVLEDEVITTDDRRRWLRDLTRSFAALAPKGMAEAKLRRLEQKARLAPPDPADELDQDPEFGKGVARHPRAPARQPAPVAELPTKGHGELVPDPEYSE